MLFSSDISSESPRLSGFKNVKTLRNINNQNHMFRIFNHTINNEKQLMNIKNKKTNLDYSIIQSTMKVASKDNRLSSRIKITPKKSSIRRALLSARIALGSLIRLPGIFSKLNVC